MSEIMLIQSSLFQGITRDEIETMLIYLSATRREFRKDEHIVREGDLVRNIGILLSGTAQSVKIGFTGKQVIVTRIQPGNYIGVLLAASHVRTSPVTVQALENLVVLFIPMRNILSRHDYPHREQLLSNLLDGIAEKALILHDRNDCLVQPSIRDKVLTFLSEFADTARSNSFVIPMNRDTMAEYLDVDRSALSRELSWMKRDGLINYEKSWFQLQF